MRRIGGRGCGAIPEIPRVARRGLGDGEVLEADRQGRTPRHGTAIKTDGRVEQDLNLGFKVAFAPLSRDHDLNGVEAGLREGQTLENAARLDGRIARSVVPFKRRIGIGHPDGLEAETVLLKTLRVRRFEEGLEQPRHLEHLCRRVGTLEVGQRHQLHHIGSGTIIGPRGKGVITHVQIAGLPELPDITGSTDTVVVEGQGEAGAEVLLGRDGRRGRWGRGPIEHAAADAAVLHNGQFGLHILDLWKSNSIRSRERAGTARGQIAEVPREVRPVVGLRRPEIEDGRSGRTIEPRHFENRIDGSEDIVHRGAGVRTGPTGVGHERHRVGPGFRKGVTRVGQIGRVRFDPGHTKIPMEEGGVDRELLEIDGLADAQLAARLDGHLRGDVRVTDGDVELEIPVGRAEQDAIPPLLHADANHILSSGRGLARDEARHGIDGQGRV